MNKLTRNLILPAAALAALLLAPTSEARDFARDRGNESREYGHSGWGRRGHEGRGHEWRGNRHYAAPHYAYRYAAPWRVISGYRFYTHCPGPGWVYVAGGGWVLPPFFGAVWVPPHYDLRGFWIEGFWR